MRTLDETFDTRHNSLNALRLLLAVGVIAWHTVPLTGRSTSGPGAELAANIFVDGFFAISGFLITASWLRKPRVATFVWARFLRIMPGYWVCLIMGGFVFAPLSVWIAGSGEFRATDGLRYLAANWTVHVNDFGVGTTLADVPYPSVWDGSLWTLWWEVLCYFGVLALGVVGLLRYRYTAPILFAGAVAGLIIVTVHPVHNYLLETAPRFAVMFLAGATLYVLRGRMPIAWWIVGCAGAVVVVSTLLPDYRIIAAVPLAYVCIAVGVLVQRPVIRNDLSYGVYIYAFCIQQLMVSAGWDSMPAFLFFLLAALATLPLAAGSWFLVEKPALAMKARFRRRPPDTSGSIKPAQTQAAPVQE